MGLSWEEKRRTLVYQHLCLCTTGMERKGYEARIVMGAIKVYYGSFRPGYAQEDTLDMTDSGYRGESRRPKDRRTRLGT